MVAADDERLLPHLAQAREKIVEQGHGLGGGRALIVNVARDQERIRLFARGERKDLLQNVRLILQKRTFIHPLAQMQIR